MTKIRRQPRLPKAKPPDSAEREYLRFLNKYVQKYIDLMRQGLSEVVPQLKGVAADELPMVRKDAFRMDENIEARLKRLFDMIGVELDKSFSDFVLRRAARAMINNVNKSSKLNTQRQVKAGYPKDKESPDLEPLMTDKKLSPYFDNVVDENVGLIKSIPRAKLETFKNQLVSMITQDATHAQIRDAIAKNFDLTKNHAALIATDQVGKLNGALNKYRQQQLGGRRYKWHTTKDGRERPDHRKLDGKVFFWSRPPIVDSRTKQRGNPGDAIRCRCWPEMILDDILD